MRAFLRQRLGLSTGAQPDDVADGLPVELDASTTGGSARTCWTACSPGSTRASVSLAEIARGTLPPGGARRAGDRQAPGRRVERSLSAPASTAAGGAGDARDQRRPGGGIRLTGTVSGVRGGVLLGVGYSRLGPRQRIAAWVRLLALSAAHPEVPYEAVTIGRGAETTAARTRRRRDRADPSARATTRRSAGGSALEELGKLAALRAEGMREPLPLPGRTAAAYAQVALRRRR